MTHRAENASRSLLKQSGLTPVPADRLPFTVAEQSETTSAVGDATMPTSKVSIPTGRPMRSDMGQADRARHLVKLDDPTRDRLILKYTKALGALFDNLSDTCLTLATHPS